VALKLYTGPLKWNEINDEVDVAHTTATYNLAQFERGLRNIVLEDYMEQGSGKWSSSENPWSIVDVGTYFSPSQAWRAADANASLKTVVNLTNISHPILKFRTYHRLTDSSDVAYVKVSSNGSNWQTIATLRGHIASWKTKGLDLRAFANRATVYLRFELASAGGISNDFLYIDDVLVAGDPYQAKQIFLPMVSKK
jgi:hypothetical protein